MGSSASSARRFFGRTTVFVLLGVLCGINAVARAQTSVPSITLQRGEFYFRLDGKPAFLLGRNPAGWRQPQFATLLRWAGESGERIARIQIVTGNRVRGRPGEVDEAWARWWDQVFDMAEQNGVYVLPVFGVWADWNDGSTGQTFAFWPRNIFNVALRGPASSPTELLQDTPARRLWLEWLQKLVTRWQGRSNILGWEVFSEIDLITGATEDMAVDFAGRAAQVVRAADTRGRPVTVSLSGIREWPELFRLDALDFLEVHPYANIRPFSGNLDDLILSSVRQRISDYGKPVFIGESGLSSGGPRNTLSVSARAHIGVKQALWAAAVSGAMNGRMLWWQDGYDQFIPGLDLRTAYKEASAPLGRFLRGVDRSGFRPVEIAVSSAIQGAAVGNAELVLGWVRDTRSAAPSWPARSLSGQTVSVTAPGAAREWAVVFYDTDSGEPAASASARHGSGGVVVTLPTFEGSIAFQLRPGDRAGHARDGAGIESPGQ